MGPRISRPHMRQPHAPIEFDFLKMVYLKRIIIGALFSNYFLIIYLAAFGAAM
jgi:hypothetical protein